jgi:hypothetical protein
MRKETCIKSYTALELKAFYGRSRNDMKDVDAMTDAGLQRVIAEDEDARDLQPDLTRAKDTVAADCCRIPALWRCHVVCGK